MGEEGTQLLQAVAVRILAKWVEGTRGDAAPTGGRASFGGRGVDLIYHQGLTQVAVKVKADPYFGMDLAKIDDRDLAFYRRNQSSYAFEAVANVATRERGWMFDSDAAELFYYYIAISQSEAEVAELASEDDDVLFSELQVDADELVIMPMAEVRLWFEENHEKYAPRPVTSGFTSAWFRVVPRRDLESAVPNVRSAGGIFRSVKA